MEQKSFHLHQLFIELKLVNYSVTKPKDLVDKYSNNLSSLLHKHLADLFKSSGSRQVSSKKKENLKI
jgi:hypothetical protein